MSNSLEHAYRNNLSTWLLLLFVLLLPFFHKFSNIILGILFALSIIEIIQKKKFPRVHLFWFLPSLFFYYAASELLSGGSWSSFEKRLLLIAIPVVLALHSDSYKTELRKKIFLSFIIGNLLAVMICFARATVRSIALVDGHWKFKAAVGQSQHDFLTSSVMEGNHYFGYEFSFFLPTPTYFGIYLVFAQYLIFELIRSSAFIKQKKWLILCFLIFQFTLFLLSSKAAIISSLFLFIYIGCYILSRYQINFFARIAVIVGILTVSGLFLFFNPRLQALKQTVEKGEIINPDARFGDDLRILSWDASLHLIKDNWLIGVGEGKKTSRLAEVYVRKGYDYPAERLLNSHNQYLDFFLGGGLIGFGLFMIGLIHLITLALRERDFPLLALMLIFSFNFLFENLLSRHAGILLFSAFVSLLVNKGRIPSRSRDQVNL